MIAALAANRKLSAVLAAVIVLIVVAVMMFMQWQTAASDRDIVEKDLKSAEAQLIIYSVDYDTSELEAERDVLARAPTFPDKLQVVGLGLFLAEGAYLTQIGLEIVDPPAEPPAQVGKQEIGTGSYPVYETTLKATGRMSQIILFLQYIEGGAFDSIRIQDLSCILAGEGGADWVAEFTVVVVTQS